MHSSKLKEKGVKNGIFHITDWMPTLASIAGTTDEQLDEMSLDGINQRSFLLENKESRRNEFVYNIKTAPFKAGYRLGRYKLLWGEHNKGGWYGADLRESNSRNLKIDWENLQKKLVDEWNLVDLDDEDWDLEDEKRTPSTNPNQDFEELSKDQPIILFDIEKDPLETKDISRDNSVVVNEILKKILNASKTMRTGNFNAKSVLGHPFFHGGNFVPGWCNPE